MSPHALALCEQIREQIRRTPGGFSELARRTGIHRIALHHAFPEQRRNNRAMSLATLDAVVEALGLRLSLTRGDPR